jgi:hypothetical protein
VELMETKDCTGKDCTGLVYASLWEVELMETKKRRYSKEEVLLLRNKVRFPLGSGINGNIPSSLTTM